MNIADYLYPLDVTGVALTNKVSNERQTLNPPSEALDFHFILPFAGPYYRDSMRLVHITTGRLLTRGIDWMPGHRFQSASYELESIYGGVYGSILFLDRTLSGLVQLAEYQTLGGEWTLDENHILDILSNRATDPRSVTFDEVSDKPLLFPPVEHGHPVDDFTGMSEMIEATNDVAAAIRQRTDDWLENPPILFGEYYTRTQIDVKFNGIATKFQMYYTAAEVDQKLHNLELGVGSGDYYTKVEINTVLDQVFGNFDNYYRKTEIDSKIGVIDARADALEDDILAVDGKLDTHATSQQNPHETTPDQIGAVGIAEYGPAMQQISDQLAQLSTSKLNVSQHDLDMKLKADKTEVGTNGRRDVHISTDAPTADIGKVGDIYYQY